MVIEQYIVPICLAFFAGLATGIGGLITFAFKIPKEEYLHLGMGFSAGLMIFISFIELLGKSITGIGPNAFFSFFAGIIVIYLIDVLVPHNYGAEQFKNIKNKKIYTSAMLIMLGITIHNFPEGLAVAVASLYEIKLGIAIAITIAIHNIPEGIAVAMPIYQATKSKIKAIKYAFLTGLAEPVGALVGVIFLHNLLSQSTLYYIFAAVAGVMTFIAFDELLPYALKYKNRHSIIISIFAGMAVAAISLFI